MILVRPSVEILGDVDGGRILESIERAGRTCYKSEDKITGVSSGKFVRSLIARGHESVIEHEKITVKIICDRGVSHEIVRHRIASYSQESTRYCDYAAGQLTFVIPPWVKIPPCGPISSRELLPDGLYDLSDLEWFRFMLYSEAMYLTLRDNGWRPEQARAVLPNSLKTEIVMTANLRQWRHILKLRAAPTAHPQMVEIAKELLRQFEWVVPVVFTDILPGNEVTE